MPNRILPALVALATVLLCATTNVTAEPAATASPVASPPVVSLDAALAAAPPSAAGATVTAWRITDTMPAHLHREHEEIIFVRSGRARARLGDRDVDLKAGDVFLVPKNVVHAARAIGEEPFEGISVFAPAFDGRDRVPVPTPAASPTR
jgi:quercetin dioxygenase-like cupin family protein